MTTTLVEVKLDFDLVRSMTAPYKQEGNWYGYENDGWIAFDMYYHDDLSWAAHWPASGEQLAQIMKAAWESFNLLQPDAGAIVRRMRVLGYDPIIKTYGYRTAPDTAYRWYR